MLPQQGKHLKAGWKNKTKYAKRNMLVILSKKWQGTNIVTVLAISVKNIELQNDFGKGENLWIIFGMAAMPFCSSVVQTISFGHRPNH